MKLAKSKTIALVLAAFMMIAALSGCDVTVGSEESNSGELSDITAGSISTPDTTNVPSHTDSEQTKTSLPDTLHTGQIAAALVSINTPEMRKKRYIEYMKILNQSISDMDELFYQEKDLDNDGNTEIIAAFGDKSNNEYSTDWIKASFALCDRNGKIELIKQDFCDGGGYECRDMQFARFTGSDNTYIIVGTTNGAYMNGLTIYEVTGNDVKELGGTASPTGVCDAYLSDERSDGSYGGFTETLSSYDVFYFSVTTFYKFSNGDFEPQGSTVALGDYPIAPTDVVIQYLSLNCLIQTYYSPDITNRIYELAGHDRGYYIYGAPTDWYSAIYKYVLGIDLPDEPSLTVQETVSGEVARVNITLENSQNAVKVTIDFDMTLSDEKWHISYAVATISVGTDEENIIYSTYSVQKKYYNDEGGYADLDLALPQISGHYDGIPQINEFFTAKEQFFYNQLPLDILQSSGKVEGEKDNYYRSAYYLLEVKIGEIISLSAYLDGGAGGVGWAGIEGNIFNLSTGKKLELSDIFKVNRDEYMTYIYNFVSEVIASKIQKDGDNSEYLFDDPYSGDGYERIREHNEKNFYLTGDSLAVFYEKYALAIGAAGPQVFYIPYSLISDILAIPLSTE